MKRGSLLFLAGTLSLFSSSVHAADCPFDGNPTLRGTKFSNLASWFNGIPAGKDEFETTAAYQARIGSKLWQAAGHLRSVQQNFGGIVVSKALGYSAKYNADAGVISVTEISDYMPALQDLILDSGTTEYWGITVFDNTVSLGTTEATNGFGAKVTVHEDAAFEDSVAFLGIKGHDSDIHWSLPIKIKVPPAAAKAIEPRLELAIAGRPAAPFFSKGERHSDATYSVPFETTTSYRIVFARPICAVIRDPVTKTIYARWPK